VRRVGYQQELYLDARSAKCKIKRGEAKIFSRLTAIQKDFARNLAIYSVMPNFFILAETIIRLQAKELG
jgi:hypothetical protein